VAKRINSVIGLFDNINFRKFGYLLFERDLTEADVATRTGISTKKIHLINRKFSEYVIPSKNASNTPAGQPIHYSIRLVVDYFTKILDLNKEEIGHLETIISDKDIKTIIFKDNYDTENIITKVVLTILLIKSIEGIDDSKNKLPLSYIINITFREATRAALWELMESDEAKIQAYNNKKDSFTKFIVNTKESDRYESAIRKYAHQYGDSYLIFLSLSKKFFRSRKLHIQTYPSAWYGILISILYKEHILETMEFDRFLKTN